MKVSRPNLSNVRITAQHWHYAGLVVLILLNATLAVRLLVAWNQAKAGEATKIAAQQSQYRAMQLKTQPLRGLDKKITQAEGDQQAFYEKRFPASYSSWLTELGALAVANNVLYQRGQYTQGKLYQGLYPLRMEVSLSGDYAPIVRFINGLERDKTLFLIEGIALSGQQNGVVNLRMRLSTYLRAGSGNSSGVTALPSTAADSNSMEQQ